MNSSSSSIFLSTMEISATEGAYFQELQPLHCQKDALTDFFGWILQIILAGIAFSCLIGMMKINISVSAGIVFLSTLITRRYFF